MATENDSASQPPKPKNNYLFKVEESIESLPNIKWLINSTRRKYLIYKRSSAVTQLMFHVAEYCFSLWLSIFMLLAMCLPFTKNSFCKVPPVFFSSQQPSTPSAEANQNSVRLVDELLSHQLEFLDQRLEKKTGSIYKPEEGYFYRVWRTCYFLFRMAIFLPRLFWRIIKAMYLVTVKEVKDIVKLFKCIFEPARQVRRSTRRRKVRIAETTMSSPDKKRKRAPSSDEEIEEYLYIDEQYHSGEDPDYSLEDDIKAKNDRESGGESNGESNVESNGESNVQSNGESNDESGDESTHESGCGSDESMNNGGEEGIKCKNAQRDENHREVKSDFEEINSDVEGKDDEPSDAIKRKK